MSYFDSMRETLESQISKRIEQKRRDVFLRADFDDLGGYDQIGRTLRQLVRNGRLLRIGSGLYARARPSTIDGKPTPVKGLRDLANEALRRVGVRFNPVLAGEPGRYLHRLTEGIVRIAEFAIAIERGRQVGFIEAGSRDRPLGD